jgi:hypothetical protein
MGALRPCSHEVTLATEPPGSTTRWWMPGWSTGPAEGTPLEVARKFVGHTIPVDAALKFITGKF